MSKKAVAFNHASSHSSTSRDPIAPADIGAVSSALATTKGDILARTSSGLTRLGVGADGFVLTASAAAPTGLAWAAPSGGGGGAPSGAAGGDLGGTYPNPTVTQARGLRETAGPTTLAMGAVEDGQVLKRSGSTVVGAWLALALAVSGAHGVDGADGPTTTTPSPVSNGGSIV